MKTESKSQNISITNKWKKVLGVTDLEPDEYSNGKGSFANSLPQEEWEIEKENYERMMYALDKPNRDARNAAYIAKLKEEGRYGEVVEGESTTNFHVQGLGIFDNKEPVEPPKYSICFPLSPKE